MATEATSTTSSANTGIKAYLKMADQAGDALKTAETRLNDALKAGDPNKIQQEKIKYDSAARVFEMVSAIMKRVDDILSAIINRIGR